MNGHQIDQYREDGVVIVPGVLDELTRKRMQSVLARLVNDDILAVGVMLDDTSVENGALHVLPGTHKGPTYDRHGSAQNTSDRPRGLLLYSASAADAFPLTGITGYDEFKGRLLCGEETIVPRFRDVPVRMPLPPAKNQGSIYENQTTGKRYFGLTNVGGKRA